MKRYIKSARLDTQRLRTAADKSRAKHLFNLMNEQEAQAQRDYDRSSESYYRSKSKMYQYADRYAAYLNDAISEINQDIENASKEYSSPDDDWTQFEILGDVREALLDLDISYTRGDGLSCKIYDISSEYVQVTLASLHREYVIAKIGFDEDDLPSEEDIKVNDFNARGFCDIVYDIYTDQYSDYDWNKIYNYGIGILDQILKDIENAVMKGIETYLDNNPPALG
jgi:hypothetical protein